MFTPAPILKQLRVVLTALTLLFVLGLNNREVTTFTPAPPDPATAHQVQKQTTDHHGVITQKISFEATSSYITLQLAVCSDWARLICFEPRLQNVLVYRLTAPVAGFFRIFFATAIQPNAP